ncbi:MAG: YraN family protein [Verrucomicrobiota bacterium]
MPPSLTQAAPAECTPAELGRWGERLAARFLAESGLKVLRRNFRARHGGELDLVCREGKVLVFVEVKTRRSDFHGRPIEAIDEEKRRLLIRGAMEWLRHLHYPDVFYRFDVVEVLAPPGQAPEIQHVPNAFQTTERHYR